MRPHEGNGNGHGTPEQKIKALRRETPTYSVGESWYNIQREWYVSLTTDMKQGIAPDPLLLEWIKKNGHLGDEYRDARAAAGTRVDQAIQVLINGETVKLSDYARDEAKAILGFRNFMKEYDPKVWAVQRTVRDDVRKIAGTFDLWVDIDGKHGPMDTKFTKNLYPEHGAQNQSYARMAELQTGVKADMSRLLQVGAKNKAGFKLVEEEYDPEYHDVLIDAAHTTASWRRKYREGPILPEALPRSVSLGVNGHPVSMKA